jgi:hypothetical protein
MTDGNQGTYPQSCTRPGPAPTRFLVGSDLHVPPPAASSSFGRQRIGPPPPRSPRATTGLALRHHRLLLCHRPDCLGDRLLDAPVAARLCAVVGSSSPRPRAPIGELNVSSLPGSSSTPMSLVGEVDVESLSGIAPLLLQMLNVLPVIDFIGKRMDY